MLNLYRYRIYTIYTVYLFIYLFICSLFNDVLYNNEDYIASNERVISE
jgi:hypothetical protein